MAGSGLVHAGGTLRVEALNGQARPDVSDGTSIVNVNTGTDTLRFRRQPRPEQQRQRGLRGGATTSSATWRQLAPLRRGCSSTASGNCGWASCSCPTTATACSSPSSRSSTPTRAASSSSTATSSAAATWCATRRGRQPDSRPDQRHLVRGHQDRRRTAHQAEGCRRGDAAGRPSTTCKARQRHSERHQHNGGHGFADNQALTYHAPGPAGNHLRRQPRRHHRPHRRGRTGVVNSNPRRQACAHSNTSNRIYVAGPRPGRRAGPVVQYRSTGAGAEQPHQRQLLPSHQHHAGHAAAAPGGRRRGHRHSRPAGAPAADPHAGPRRPGAHAATWWRAAPTTSTSSTPTISGCARSQLRGRAAAASSTSSTRSPCRPASTPSTARADNLGRHRRHAHPAHRGRAPIFTHGSGRHAPGARPHRRGHRGEHGRRGRPALGLGGNARRRGGGVHLVEHRLRRRRHLGARLAVRRRRRRQQSPPRWAAAPCCAGNDVTINAVSHANLATVSSNAGGGFVDVGLSPADAVLDNHVDHVVANGASIVAARDVSIFSTASRRPPASPSPTAAASRLRRGHAN